MMAQKHKSTITVSLTPELERLVDEKVKSGLYHTVSEVVRDAIRLLVERDKLREMRVASLRREIQVGLDELDRGERVPSDQVFTEIRKKSRERRKRRT
jgi:antitoxin ParD1/3/4